MNGLAKISGLATEEDGQFAVGNRKQAKAKRISLPLPRRLSLILAAVGLLSLPVYGQIGASALPSGGTVAAGAAAISQAGNALRIDQSSAKAIIDWNSFNIGRDASVRFNQPSTSSITLNRVGADGGRSLIDGQLSANGQVFLLNPSGMIFGPTARIDVGGLVASTLSLSNADFLAGNLHFVGDGKGGIINQGQLTAADGGYVALLAPEVRNEGVIAARLGSVALASGEQIRLDLAGDSLISIAVEKSAVTDLVDNKQLVQADGGWVVMSAGAASSLTAGAVNNEGIIRASSLVQHDGYIRLEGGQVTLSGTLDASSSSSKGGRIDVTGDQVWLRGATLDASGQSQGGLVRVGGPFQGGKAQGTTSDTYRRYVGRFGALPDLAHARTVFVDASSQIKVGGNGANNGGTAVIWSDDRTAFYGQIAGLGASAEVSSGKQLDWVNLTGIHLGQGYLLLDPKNIIIDTGGGDPVSPEGFNDTPSATANIDAGALASTLTSTSVTLQANNDITVNSAISAGSSTRTLTLQAGRNVVFNANVDVGGSASGALDVVANEIANGVDVANRDPGAGGISIANSVNLTVGAGPMTMVVRGASNAGTIASTGSGSITAGTLFLDSQVGIDLQGNNNIGSLGYVNRASGTVNFVNNNINGLTLNQGGNAGSNTTLTNKQGTLTIAPGASPVLANGLPSGSGTIILMSNAMDIQGSVQAFNVWLSPVTQNGTVSVALGGNAADNLNFPLTLGLSNAELANINAGQVHTGCSGFACDVSVVGDIGAASGRMGYALSIHGNTAAINSGSTIYLANQPFDTQNTNSTSVNGNIDVGSGFSAFVTLGGGAGGTPGSVTGTGNIIANGMKVTATGGINLSGANNVAAVELINNTSGDVIYNSDRGAGNTLDVKGSSTTAPAFTITENSGNIVISGGNTIDTTGGGAATGSNLTLNASGSSGTISGSGILVAPTMSANGSSGINLTGANKVGEVDLSSVGGSVLYKSNLGSGKTLKVSGGASSASGTFSVDEASGNLSVGTSRNTSGIFTLGGPVSLIAEASDAMISLGSGASINTMGQGDAFNGGDVTLQADKIDLSLGNNINTVTYNGGTSGNVKLLPFAAGKTIRLGATGDTTANTLELSSAELNQIIANTVFIGDANSGNISLTGNVPISFTAGTGLGSPQIGFDTLVLQSGGTVSTVSNSLTIGNLAIQSVGNVDLSGAAQSVNNLAVNISGSGNQLKFLNAKALTVGTVDTVNGVGTSNGDIKIGLSAGDLTLTQNIAAGSGTVEFKADAGAVNESGAAIIADKLQVTAANGASLTNSANSINTFAAAVSNSGQGITLSNNKGVAIGTVGSTNGISAAGGGIAIKAAGPINVNQGISDAGGNVTLDATSTGPVTGSGVIQAASLSVISASGINLTGANDVSTVNLANAGSNGVNYVSDVGAANNLNINGTNGSGGFVVNEASGNIVVGPSSVDAIVTNGGAINLTAHGAGKMIQVNSNIDTTGGNRSPTGAGIILQADKLYLANAIGSVNAGSNGGVNLKPMTAGTSISLGTANKSVSNNILEISSADLNKISARGIQVGDGASGNISLDGSISPTGSNALLLNTGGTVSVPSLSGNAITITNLAINAAGSVDLSGSQQNVSNLAAQVTGNGSQFLFANSGSLNIAAAAGITGISTQNGQIDIFTNNGNLTVTNNVTSGGARNRLEAGGDNNLLAIGSGVTVSSSLPVQSGGKPAVELSAGRINILGSVSGPVVALGTNSVNRAIYLGADDVNAASGAGGAMGLTNAELNRISATHIGIGGDNSSPTQTVHFMGPVTLSSVPHLVLTFNAGVSQASNAALTVSDLTLQSDGNVDMPAANQVSNLAAQIAGNLSFNDTSNLTITQLFGTTTLRGNGNTIASINGISANAASVVTSGDLTLNAPVSASASQLSNSWDRDILLETTNGVFTNNVGPQALNAGPLGWWIWAVSPNQTTLNGLAPDFTRYDAQAGNLYKSSLPSGNGVIYQSGSATPVNPVTPVDTNPTTDNTVPTTETTVTKASDATTTTVTSGSSFPSQTDPNAPPPKLIVDSSKSVPRAAGVLDKSDLDALNQQAHEGRTLMFADALGKLSENPDAADVPTCKEGDSASVCIASGKSGTGGNAQVTAEEFLAPVINRKIALLIGNNAYHSPIPELETAVGDVTAIGDELRDRFGYEVKVVQNGTRKDIVEALNGLIRTTERDDSVLVMYAGHGYLDEKKKIGYWIPVDGGNADPGKWISNSAIAKALGNIPAKQVMLVSDSCYSGSLTKEGKVVKTVGKDRDNALTRRSVLALSSGGEEPVSDEGYENHSIFAWSMIQALRKADGDTSGQELHASIKDAVAKEFPQVPQYGVVTSAGHREGGEFLLTPKN